MALGDILGSIFGGDAGKEEMEQSLKLSREARDELKNVYVPTVAEQEILLQNPELAGLLQAEQYGNSEFENISADPRLREAQLKALEQMSGLAETGLGAEDRAAFNELRRSAAGEAQAQNASVLQNAAAQGTLSSGNTLMAQLMAGQQSANRMSSQGDNIAAQAASARREALMNKANMASQLNQQDYSRKSDVARAQDAISQFNSQNRQNVNQYNLGQKQNINNQKATNANQQQMYNKGLVQQQFQNNLSKATGVAGATQNLAGQYAQQGQAAAQGQANMTSGLINTAAGMGAAYAGSGGGAAPGVDQAGGVTQYSRDYLKRGN